MRRLSLVTRTLLLSFTFHSLSLSLPPLNPTTAISHNTFSALTHTTHSHQQPTTPAANLLTITRQTPLPAMNLSARGGDLLFINFNQDFRYLSSHTLLIDTWTREQTTLNCCPPLQLVLPLQQPRLERLSHSPLLLFRSFSHSHPLLLLTSSN